MNDSSKQLLEHAKELLYEMDTLREKIDADLVTVLVEDESVDKTRMQVLGKALWNMDIRECVNKIEELLNGDSDV